jgi:hypothetical protein
MVRAQYATLIACEKSYASCAQSVQKIFLSCRQMLCLELSRVRKARAHCMQIMCGIDFFKDSMRPFIWKLIMYAQFVQEYWFFPGRQMLCYAHYGVLMARAYWSVM